MKLAKFLKASWKTVCCAALLLPAVAMGGTQEAQAASKTEIETYGTALALNQTATGVLIEEDEQDWFIFDITERGYFTVNCGRNDSADTGKIHYGWKCSLYHEDDLVNPAISAGDITNKYGSTELPLPEGRYYICMEGSSSLDFEQPIGCPYDVTVYFTQTDIWEHEYNDTNATANVIEVNQTYYGNFHRYDDVDWYQVTAPEDGILQMDFGSDVSTDVADIGYGWKVTLLDAEFNTIREYIYKNKWTPQFLPFAKGTFYIKAEPVSSWDFEQPINCLYNLQLKHIPATDWETEYNNEYEKADVITSGSECHGLLFVGSDEDWYKIDTPKDSLAAVQFRVDGSVSVDDIQYGWKIIVYNEQRELITGLDDVTKTTTKEEIRLPGGTVYIKVQAASSWEFEQPADCIYHIKVTTTPVKSTGNNTGSRPSATDTSAANNSEAGQIVAAGRITIDTVTAKKESVYLCWKKQEYAGGYEIYRSTRKKGAYKKVKTVNNGKKVSWTDKRVSSGKTYFYKIRALIRCSYSLKEMSHHNSQMNSGFFNNEA